MLLTLSNHNIQYKDTYKTVKKEYDNLLKNTQIQKFENRVISSDNKMKCMWAIKTEITVKNCSKNNIGLVGNAEKVANEYNEFLITVVPKILKTIDFPFNSLNISYNNKSMNLIPTTPQDLAADIIKKHSCDVDEIPTSIKKLSIPVLKVILSYLVNSSFKNGIFPFNLKLALIKPFYKKGAIEEMDSYRPISLLPGFSKILELAMRKRLNNF